MTAAAVPLAVEVAVEATMVAHEATATAEEVTAEI
tara:strand:+ start:1114 stop:1218 length:105 start_codon:yes stop_codon:yes gene_type:complete